MNVFFASIIVLLISITPGMATSKMDVSLNFGPSIAQYGAIDDLGDPSINTGLEFNFFIKEAHGVGFSFSNEFDFEGSSKFPGIREASISTFDIHYVYRQIFSPKFQLLFAPGIGWQTLYDETGDYYWYYTYYDDLSTSLILDYKLMGRFIVSEWGSEGTDGSFFLGGGIMQIFSMDDSYNGKDISGSRISFLFQIGLGF